MFCYDKVLKYKRDEAAGDMFTGIVEEKGIVESITNHSLGAILKVRAPCIRSDTKIGDSISVNGCCLTVTHLEDECLLFDVVLETLSKTCLVNIGIGSQVNIEGALRLNDRFGGHYVQGHIDTTGHITQFQVNNDGSAWISIQLPEKFIKYIVKKGSITVDGISLTVADTGPDCFSIALIPHTVKFTTLGTKKLGDLVNIETDIIAKHLEQLVKDWAISSLPSI